MKKKLISIAIASLIATSTGHVMANQDIEDSTDDNQQVTAIGIGAVSGALLAGPAGLIVGGIVGAIAGRQDSDLESDVQGIDHLAETESMLNEMLEASKKEDVQESIVVASTDNELALIEVKIPDTLKEIISNDLSMDVYFKAGSVDVENFYAQQLSTISNLLGEIPELQLVLDGYSDRQGSEADNFQLSIARLESVRKYFENQSIDGNRITTNAYGEKKFISKSGDLSAYMFDRRVEVSFKDSSNDKKNSVATITGSASF